MPPYSTAQAQKQSMEALNDLKQFLAVEGMPEHQKLFMKLVRKVQFKEAYDGLARLAQHQSASGEEHIVRLAEQFAQNSGSDE